MMEKDLTKMVDDFAEKHLFSYGESQFLLLLAMAKQTEANRKEIEKLKTENPKGVTQ